jgi:hypothetical protein
MVSTSAVGDGDAVQGMVQGRAAGVDFRWAGAVPTAQLHNTRLLPCGDLYAVRLSCTATSMQDVHHSTLG